MAGSEVALNPLPQSQLAMFVMLRIPLGLAPIITWVPGLVALKKVKTSKI